jgi:glycerophosphoryl diester phosphodiesterase
VLVLGHRGRRTAGDENSLAAVAAALAAGAHGVEVDVRRLGADLVLAHDWAPAYPGAPTVAELLVQVGGRARVVLEVKNTPGEPDFDAPGCAAAEALGALFADRAGQDDVVVSSFDWHTLRALAGRVPTALLTPPGIALRAGLAVAADLGLAELHPHWTEAVADADAVAEARSAGMGVVCWTVDGLAVARRLADAGATGVIADDPGTLLAGWTDGASRGEPDI